MANVQRYRTGRISEVRGVVLAGVLAEIGDLVALDSNKVTTFTGLATTSALFADKFLGVLVQGATVGTETTADQVVATGSVIADAIGRLCKPVAVGDTTCVVKIQSVVALGGAQAAS
jgi:hypothetical protein